MHPVFCTIITPDYYPYVRVQFDFLRKYNQEVQFHVFVSENVLPDIYRQDGQPGLIFHAIDTVCGDGVGRAIYEKYYQFLGNRFRWAMKPVILKYLLQQGVSDRVIYIDWDIQFYNKYDFLFDELVNNSVIITPQWNAMRTASNLSSVLNLYNAGFVGVNKTAVDLMEWWANECLYKCDIDLLNGYYVDQTYLHYFHLHEGITVGVIKHRGCNVADWNKQQNTRTVQDGQVLINGRFPVIFIHYSFTTARRILRGGDDQLLPYFEEYSNAFAKYNGGVKLTDIEPYRTMRKKPAPLMAMYENLKEKIRLKTRIRGFVKGIR